MSPVVQNFITEMSLRIIITFRDVNICLELVLFEEAFTHVISDSLLSLVLFVRDKEGQGALITTTNTNTNTTTTTIPCQTTRQGVGGSSCNGYILFVVTMWHWQRTSRPKHERQIFNLNNLSTRIYKLFVSTP
jgi:hypothetical protein